MNILSGIAESVHLMFRRPSRGQFAALCYRIEENSGFLQILLLTSRDTGRWVIPKGWPMGEKPGYEVAKQEALEEAGVLGDAEPQPAGYYSYEKCLDHGIKVPCRVQVHPVKVTGTVENFKEKGKRKLEWVSPEIAASRVHEPQLKQLIRQFADRFNQREA